MRRLNLCSVPWALALALILPTTSIAIMGCDSDPDVGDGGVSDADTTLDAGPQGPAEICVGIRGNGELITAHFAALSRFVEHYGMPAGGAGGSSASISLFMLESVAMNPLVNECAGRSCSEEETRSRAALLLKSFPGYVQVLQESEEGLAFHVLTELSNRVSEGGVAGLLDSDTAAAVDALRTILDSEDLAELVNPELRGLLEGDHPVFHTRDIVDSLAGGSFNASDHLIFIRPGLLNFPALANNLGNMGSFYAGYEPANRSAMSAWLDACAERSPGQVWSQVAALSVETSTCGQLFSAMVEDYRRQLSTGTFASRADDIVGQELRLAVATGVLQNTAITTWQAARQDYLNADDSTLDVNFDDVRIGYFGNPEDLDPAVLNPQNYTDLKTSMAVSLGAYSWRRILSMSPAEPGLSRGIELDDGRISVGGWPDLQPTLILRNMGCDKVVYLTRQGSNSQFGRGVAFLLGMSEEQGAAYLDFDNADSSAYLSIAESDAVWCTDWDSFNGFTEVEEVTADAYNAPLESIDPFFGAADMPYPNLGPPADRPACTLGVVPAPAP